MQVRGLVSSQDVCRRQEESKIKKKKKNKKRNETNKTLEGMILMLIQSVFFLVSYR